MTTDLAGVPIADIGADPSRRAGFVKGAAAESSERSPKPTLDEAEHRVHFPLLATGTGPNAAFSSRIRPTEPTQSRVNEGDVPWSAEIGWRQTSNYAAFIFGSTVVGVSVSA
jgi:hypothetical protein